jgi:hypothetical protein
LNYENDNGSPNTSTTRKRLDTQPSPYNSTIISKPALNYNNAKVFFTNFIASSAKVQNIDLKDASEA